MRNSAQPLVGQRPNVSVGGKTISIAGGFILGMGLGGFMDGIVLHQIAQWHNMGSAVLPPTTMEATAQNMRWDGLFHLATLVLTLVGVIVLWQSGRQGTAPSSLRVLTGQMILGWGTFNLIEGVLDHHLLDLHHVRDVPVHVPAYDWVFIGVGGLGLLLVGWMMSKRPG